MSCEWNPVEGRALRSDEPAHAVATVSVGRRVNWHLCEPCSQLKRFDRMIVRTPITGDLCVEKAPGKSDVAEGSRWEKDEHDLAMGFASAMMEKLAQNRWKGGWDQESVAELLERVHEELAELVDAVNEGADAKTVRAEAADVANFLAMLVANYTATVPA